jgi:hypothetical protein
MQRYVVQGASGAGGGGGRQERRSSPDGGLKRLVDRHVRAGKPQLLDNIQQSRVVRVRADRQASAAGGMRPELVQGDGLDCFRAEPEEDHVGDAQVLVLPRGLLPRGCGLADREHRAPGVDDDGRCADRVQLEHRASLPVRAPGDAAAQSARVTRFCSRFAAELACGRHDFSVAARGFACCPAAW